MTVPLPIGREPVPTGAVPDGNGAPPPPTVTVTVAVSVSVTVTSTTGQVVGGCPLGTEVIPVGELAPVGLPGKVVGRPVGGKPGAVPVGPGPNPVPVPVGYTPGRLIPVGMGIW